MRAWLLVLLVALAPAARANQTDELNGKIHFDAGERYYRQKQYAKALAEFTAGYELTQRSAFLLNIAQTYRQLGELRKARDFYQTFIERAPESPLLPGVRQLVAQLSESLESHEPIPLPGTPPPAAPPSIAESPLVTPRPSSDASALTQPPAVEKRRRLIASWVGVGLTAASLVAAISVDAASRVQYGNLQSSCAPPHGPGCSNAQIDPVRMEAAGATGLYITAGIAAAATLVSFLIETRARRAH